MSDITYTLDRENNILKIGPLKGGLGNILPDGFLIKISISTSNEVIFQEIIESENGAAQIKLPKNLSNKTLLIECGGISKSIIL